ncbi:hypothetical protein [Daejeonella sp.]|uniref:hypothetical protein n=1 Tax=Daejeonella sp. TaxID=2805397 RepID=UPI00271A89C2|nr:hypothetical protein [Daejeonella sp.]MDO8993828.1 hypothetical protein [Daejeonella sp.]MDP2413981.1 hypothetical protein [Daejeonella sp.]
MSTSDLLASAGVSLLLIAFYLNLKKLMPTESKWYSALNCTGAALCGYSSYLIQFYPFVFLNGVWAIAAIISLFKNVPRGTIIKKL